MVEYILIGFISFVVLLIITALFLRRVVETNEVHIVQSAKATKSYGKDTPNGNTYYEWPSWVPVLGVTKIKLPVSVFDLELQAYEAYDVGRVPLWLISSRFSALTTVTWRRKELKVLWS